jgi:pilus assembly protein CpaD
MNTRRLGILLVLGAAVSLAGCNLREQMYDGYQGYVPENPDEVYPIEVVDGAARLTVKVGSGRLSAADEQVVRRFAAEAAGIPSPVIVSRPRGSVNAELVAARVTALLKEHGVAPQRIRHVTRKSRKGGVVISYKRKFAVTRECGDWSKPVTETGSNRPYRNFGCAHQHNLAAMVANPEDFENPPAMSPPSAARQVKVYEGYVSGRR